MFSSPIIFIGNEGERRHRPCAHHDDDQKIPYQHLQYDRHHGYRVHDQIHDDGNAHRRIRFYADKPVARKRRSNSGRGLGAALKRRRAAAYKPFGRRRLVSHLYAVLLRADDVDAFVFEQHENARRGIVYVSKQRDRKSVV